MNVYKYIFYGIFYFWAVGNSSKRAIIGYCYCVSVRKPQLVDKAKVVIN